MSSSKEQVLVIGGVPRADLLPPEVRLAGRDRRRVRYLVYGVIGALGLAVLGVIYAFGASIASQASLVAEQERTAELVEKQEQFAVARATAAQIDAILNARQLAMATEINWNESFKEIEASLPEGVTITSVKIDSISPIDELPVSDVPLQLGYVAALTVTASSLTVPDVEQWLDNLAAVTGFAGVAPPVSVVEGEDGYVVSIQILLNSEAFELRFADKVDGDVADKPDEVDDAGGDE